VHNQRHFVYGLAFRNIICQLHYDITNQRQKFHIQCAKYHLGHFVTCKEAKCPKVARRCWRFCCFAEAFVLVYFFQLLYQRAEHVFRQVKKWRIYRKMVERMMLPESRLYSWARRWDGALSNISSMQGVDGEIVKLLRINASFHCLHMYLATGVWDQDSSGRGSL